MQQIRKPESTQQVELSMHSFTNPITEVDGDKSYQQYEKGIGQAEYLHAQRDALSDTINSW